MGEKINRLRREQLIEATISTIAQRGFSRTTVAHVAQKAKLSQGVVNFYFKTKEGLLFETLRYLSNQYNMAWENALQHVGGDPVAGLEAIVELDLSAGICDRRKVSVWLAFWAESPGRPKFRSFCREIQRADFEQTSDMCRQIVERGAYHDVEPDDVARNLNAMVLGYWLDIHMNEKNFDRNKAKQACRQYLARMFPDDFGISHHEQLSRSA